MSVAQGASGIESWNCRTNDGAASCFGFSKDQLIFDVGHQSYVHKILTGRKNGFENLRQFHGMSDSRREKKAIVMRFTVDTAPCRYQQRLGWLQQEISIIRMRRLLR